MRRVYSRHTNPRHLSVPAPVPRRYRGKPRLPVTGKSCNLITMKTSFTLPRPVPEGPWRWLVPVLLVLLFLLVVLWLPWQARQMESNERQEQLIADTLWVEQTLRFELARSEEALAALGADLVTDTPPSA